MRYTQRQLKMVKRKKEVVAARKKRDLADMIRMREHEAFMQDMKFRREMLMNPMVMVSCN